MDQKYDDLMKEADQIVQKSSVAIRKEQPSSRKNAANELASSVNIKSVISNKMAKSNTTS